MPRGDTGEGLSQRSIDPIPIFKLSLPAYPTPAFPISPAFHFHPSLPLQLLRMIRVTSRLLKYLSSSEKPPKPAKPQFVKVSKLKIDEKLGGYKIYETDSSKSILYASIILAAGTAFSATILYLDTSYLNMFTFAVICGLVVNNQKRVMNTARRIIVDKTGTNIRVNKYGIGGTAIGSSEEVQIPIYILNGVKRSRLSKGVYISAGGAFNVPELRIHFHGKGVLDKRVFDQVVGGVLVNYADIL